VRVAIGPAGIARLDDEANRYAAIPAYAAHFQRMGRKPVATGVAAAAPEAVAPALLAWDRAVDHVVVRAITGKDTLDETLQVLRASRPA
jgi:hypothetical protein